LKKGVFLEQIIGLSKGEGGLEPFSLSPPPKKENEIVKNTHFVDTLMSKFYVT
jgi:hypothetical protein